MNLKYGSTGSEVKNLQSSLNKLGFSLAVDGSYGPATRNAITNFQKQHSLTVDGLAGPQTQGKINTLLSGGQPPSAPATPQAPQAPPKSTVPKEIPNAGYSQTPISMPNQATDLNSILKQSQDMLAPLLQQQKGTATASMNQQMQKLNDQWASRGLLASGLASTQQRQGAEALAGQLAGIDAQGQAEALSNAYNLGNFQENQRQFDLSHALDEGALTGSYLPSGARDLVNQLASQKQIIENTGSSEADRKAASQKSNDIRRALNTMGVNTDSLGGNASLQDILSQMSGGLGKQTLESSMFNREMNLKEQSERFNQDYQTKVQSFQEKQAAIDNELKKRGLDLEAARDAINKTATMSDVEYREHQMDMGINEETAKKYTNAAMARASNFNSIEDAYEWLYENAETFYNQGVDTRSVIETLNWRFGEDSSESAYNPLANP